MAKSEMAKREWAHLCLLERIRGGEAGDVGAKWVGGVGLGSGLFRRQGRVKRWAGTGGARTAGRGVGALTDCAMALPSTSMVGSWPYGSSPASFIAMKAARSCRTSSNSIPPTTNARRACSAGPMMLK
eukprot:scaffold2532_cov84-Isochrysis_galbana.AAC.2